MRASSATVRGSRPSLPRSIATSRDRRPAAACDLTIFSGEPCWNGELGKFLMMRLQLFPYDDWNVVFLPEDERTAQLMDLPVHPGGPIPGSVEIVGQFVAEDGDEIAGGDRPRPIGPIGLRIFGATVDSIKADVFGVGVDLANHIGAAAAWKPTR